MLFAWDDWNTEHIVRHGVTAREAEFVVRYARPPWPEQKGEEKFLVSGASDAGRLLQVVFVLKAPDEVEFDALTLDQWAELDEEDRVVYVIHAMDMTPGMKRLYRKRRR